MCPQCKNYFFFFNFIFEVIDNELNKILKYLNLKVNAEFLK